MWYILPRCLSIPTEDVESSSDADEDAVFRGQGWLTLLLAIWSGYSIRCGSVRTVYAAILASWWARWAGRTGGGRSGAGRWWLGGRWRDGLGGPDGFCRHGRAVWGRDDRSIELMAARLDVCRGYCLV